MPAEIAAAVDTPPEYTPANLLRLRLAGNSFSEIGDMYGKTRQAISQRLAGVFKALDSGKLDAWRGNKADILDATLSNLVSELSNPARLKSASLNNVAYAASQVHTILRLETNRSTENFSLAAVVDAVHKNLG